MAGINILYLHETSQISGAENSLMNLVNHIDGSKFKPIFVLPEEGPFPSALRKLGVEVNLIEFPKIRKIIGVLKTVRAIRRFIRQKNIHLLHSNSIRTHLYGALAAKLENIPVVWHERNLLTHEIIDPEKLFFFLPDRIICNSQAIARRFLKRGNLPDKVKVIYNGVDTEKFNPSIGGGKIREALSLKPGHIIIGIASRFSPDKGHETFLRAARIILDKSTDKGKPWRFLVAGGAVFDEDKWREKELRQLAEKLGIGGKVIFTGFRENMPEIYMAMDIFILTSEAEPCGRVLIEAAACAKPIVATDSGGTPEIVLDGITGYLFKPGDAATLAEKVISLADNIGLAKKMGEAGRKRAEEEFKIESKVRQIEKIYLGLMEK